MKKLLALVLLVASLGTAYAGYHGGSQVVIDTANRRAYGAMADARASGDARQSIECDVMGYSTTAPDVMCGVYSSTGASAFCYSNNPGIIQAAASLKDSGYIYFTWDTSGRCTYIFASTASGWAPKQP